MPTDREQLSIQETDGSVLTVEEAQGAKKHEGTVLVHLMRPCLGKGRGRHVYEAQMLEREASQGRFNDWPMYVDHRSPEAARKAQGLPRSLRDLGGRVVEAWWDPSVPADQGQGFGPGAVVAEAKPVPWVKELIDHDPKLVNVSLNTFATGVRPRNVGGRPAYVVEGFADQGSADWVTIPGAGGRVVELLEAAIEQADTEDEAVLETCSDEELAEHIRLHRPELAEALTNPKPPSGQEDTHMEPAEIQEAVVETLASDAGKAAIQSVISEAATDAVKDALREVLPDAIGAAARTIEEGATAAARNELRKGRVIDACAKDIAEAKLPEKFEAKVIATVTEAVTGMEDQTDDDDKVTETVEQQAKAVTEAEIKDAKELIGSVAPTRVSNKGGGGADDTAVEETEQTGDHWQHSIAEAGIDPAKAWGIQETEERKPSENDKADTEADKDKTAAA